MRGYVPAAVYDDLHQIANAAGKNEKRTMNETITPRRYEVLV